MDKTERLVVIGDGMAGRFAAIEAASCGLRSIVLEESPSGHFFEYLAGTDPRIAALIQVVPSVRVLGIFEGLEILWSQGETSGTFRADQILLAPGPSDRLLPFPGWTLPGVFSHGELTSRVINGDRLTEKRAIVAGTGEGLANSARELIDSGVQVVAILDAGSESRRGARFPLLRCDDSPDLAKVPHLANHAIFEAHGEGRVMKVTFGEIDPRTWTPREGPTRTEDVDLVAVGFGRIPTNHLSVIAGCKQEYDADSWSLRPILDPLCRTSVPGLLATYCGDGEAGRPLGLSGGGIAAITAAEQAGVLTAEEAAARRSGALERAAGFLRASGIPRDPLDSNGAAPLRAGLLDLLRPGTIVCKCEDVSLAEVHQAIAEGVRDLTSLKMKTRLGMGACQGRDCACAAAMILAKLTGRSPEEIGTIRPRPPARPVTLGALARMQRRLPRLDGEEL